MAVDWGKEYEKTVSETIFRTIREKINAHIKANDITMIDSVAKQIVEYLILDALENNRELKFSSKKDVLEFYERVATRFQNFADIQKQKANKAIWTKLLELWTENKDQIIKSICDYNQIES